MNVISITPTRGDRPNMYGHCVNQINRQTKRLAANLVADELPHSSDFDLVWRIRDGIKEGKYRGADYALIIEDDDWYAGDYFEYMQSQMDGADLIGFDATIYYSLNNRTWEVFNHRGRSSLYCTAIRIDAMDNFRWPPNNEKFLDMHLWKQLRSKKILKLDIENPPCIGIKHNEGLRAGIGHKARMKNSDPNMEWLKSKVDESSFEFYKDQN